jgi:multiple sugar transport system permease protein
MTLVSWREKWLLLLLLLLFILIFLIIPFGINLLYSISDVKFETLRQFNINGPENYQKVLVDREFWMAGWFSLRFGLITAALECLLGLFLAVFLSPLFKKRSWLLAILMMPMMIAPSLMGLMYRLVLHEFVGPVPYYLYEWFGNSPAFLDGKNAFRTLVVIEVLQWTPFAMLLFYVAYAGIPESIRAARIDGASATQMLRLISLPIIMPALLVGFIIRFIDGFRVFDNVFVLTRGGAGGSTTSLPIYIYQKFFQQGEIGVAVAASMIFLVLSFILLFILNRLSRSS